MKAIIGVIIFVLFTQINCDGICEKYLQEIRSQEATEQYGTFLVCVSERLAKQSVINPKANDVMIITAIKKNQYDMKFECFTQMEEPSEDLKNLAQCWKNYYEAKFEVDISIPLLANQQIGTDSQNWGDEELENSVAQKRKELRDPITIATLFFGSFLIIAFLSFSVYCIYSKCKKRINRTGFSQFDIQVQNVETKELTTV